MEEVTKIHYSWVRTLDRLNKQGREYKRNI